MHTTKVNEILNHTTQQGAWPSANKRGPSLPQGLLKFSHWKHHLEVLHAECSLQQFNFKLMTANFS
jgi:hypothetical protein